MEDGLHADGAPRGLVPHRPGTPPPPPAPRTVVAAFPPPDTPPVGMPRPFIPPELREDPPVSETTAETPVPGDQTAPTPVPAPLTSPPPVATPLDTTPPRGLVSPVAPVEPTPTDTTPPTAAPAPEAVEIDLTDGLTFALASLDTSQLEETGPSRPIDLPAECRSGLLQLLEARTQLWQRFDRMTDELERFQRLNARTSGRGAAAPLDRLTDSGDPELEASAARAIAEQELEQLQRLSAEVEPLQFALISKRKRVGRKRREKSVTELRRDIEVSRQRLRAVLDHGSRSAEEAAARLGDLIEANATTIREVERTISRAEHAPWQMARWVSWEPSTERRAGDIRLGAFTEGRSGETLAVPCVAPLVGSGRSLVLASEGETERGIATGLLQSLVVRTAVTFPQQAAYTLLDPAGNGLAFPMTRHLPHATLVGGDVRRHLDDVIAHVHRIVTTYLDATATSFEELPEEMRLGESYHFVVAADFPHGYDSRSAEALLQLARTGPRAGVYVLLHLNRDRLAAAGQELASVEFDGAHVIDVGAQTVTIGDTTGTVAFDAAPAAALQETVLHRLSAMPPRDRAVPWDELNRLREHAWWGESAAEVIRAPIGRYGAGELLELWFGTDARQLRSCVHGVLGAMPGAGKSTLLHNLICSLAVRYSPEELKLFLIDGKYGVEFRPYQQLPHAEVVSLRTSPTMSRSVLDDLVREMARRNALFGEHGVVDLTGYRAIGQPGGKLPRLLLVIDEYQQLFDGDRSGVASAALLRLSQQGRSAGIHFLLTSQRFEAGAMLQRNEIFGNVHLRMGMQISASDAAALTDFGVAGRRMITSHCDRTGRIVVNDRGGDDTANIAGKAALLTPERRDALIAALARKAAATFPTSMTPIVLDGSEPPSLLENPHLERLIALGHAPDPSELHALATAPLGEGGLESDDWRSNESPLPLFLGRDFDVRVHAVTVIRRRAAENVVFVGDRSAPRIGMLSAALLGAAAAAPAGQLEVWLGDHGIDPAGGPSSLPATADRLRALGINIRFARTPDEVAALVAGAHAEVERRRTLAPDEVPSVASVLLVLHEPERVAALLRVADEYGTVDSELGRQLRNVLAAGPAVGVHVVLSTTSLGALRSVLPDRAVQQDLRHRIVAQVPEEDSFVLVRSTAAAALDREAGAAIRYDSHRQTGVPFRPYTVSTGDPSAVSLDAQLDRVTQLLIRRGTSQ